jgi:hypothetical protein
MKKIFVGNFSFSLSEDELRSLFTPFGAVDSATVVTDRATGRSRGFGFVEMPNNEEAEKAIAGLNGKDSGGRAEAETTIPAMRASLANPAGRNSVAEFSLETAVPALYSSRKASVGCMRAARKAGK